MRSIHVFTAFTLFFASQMAFSASSQVDTHTVMSGAFGVLEPLSRILAVMFVVFGIFSGAARGNVMTCLAAFCVAFFISNIPEALKSLTGVNTGEIETSTNPLPVILEWLTENLYAIGAVAVAVIAEVILIRRATGLFNDHRQSAVTRHWKQKLIRSLEQSLDRLEDLQIKDRFDEGLPSRVNLAEERLAISALIKEVLEAKCFAHESRASLLKVKDQFGRRAKSHRGYSGRSLEDFRDVLKRMPKTLAIAQKELSNRPGCDDLLRSQISSLAEDSNASIFPKLTSRLDLRKQ